MRALFAVAILSGALAAAPEVFDTKVVVLEDFPREVGRGRDLVIKGVLRGGSDHPELIIIEPGGKTFLNRDNKVAGPNFTFTVSFDHGPGAYRMEIMAHQPSAVRTGARFTVWHAKRRPGPEEEAAPAPPAPPTPLTLHERLLEKRCFRLANAFRREIGVPEAAWNEGVASRAREHADRMARAGRRQHRFGNLGVRELLGREGPAGSGESGPPGPWDRLTADRPFDRPKPQPPGPRVRNHVLVSLGADESLEGFFERVLAGEAAHRICLADPYCTEIAVGAARQPVQENRDKETGAVTRVQGPLVYYVVCFIQINDVTLIRGQDDAHGDLLRRAAKDDPADLRLLGLWGRGGRAETLLERALKDKNASVAGAAADALLLLEEEAARSRLGDALAKARDALERGRYEDAAALVAPHRAVIYDAGIPAAADTLVAACETAAREELSDIVEREEPARTNALKDLARRTEGLPVAAEIAQLLQ